MRELALYGRQSPKVDRDETMLKLTSPFDRVIPTAKANTLLYFSMITFSSVGYGGIVPVNPDLRITAALESMVGISMSPRVARLVSSFRPKIRRVSGNEA